MSFLGLVGVPSTTITYPAYQALKAASPALGAAFAAAEGAAIATLALKGAAIVGAGALGWMVGSAIRAQLGLDNDPGFVSDWVSGGTPGEQIRVGFEFNNGINPPITSDVIVTAPFAGILRKSVNATNDQFFLRQINPPADIPMVNFNTAFVDARIRITTLEKLDGTPATNLKRVPAYPQLPTYEPTRTPVIVPATPRTPAFPITPIVIPTPGNDPDEDNKLLEPGITVQIPELGLQVQYTPTGVRYGGYRSPDTIPYTPPKIALPPGTPPPATNPCECEEGGENKDEEIICRVKTLQKEILDDGYDTEIHPGGNSSFISQQGLPDEFFLLKIAVSQKPANVKTQLYSPGAPTVYWVGWLSWRFTDRQGERIFLQFDEMEFRPPPDCTGYVIAANSGCILNAQAFTRKKRMYLDEC